MDKQWKRIAAIVGKVDEDSFDDCVTKYYEYLSQSLELPCLVTGIEDFRWEEPYVFGARPAEEYTRLKTQRPSYQDRFRLLEIEEGICSEWMMFGEDIGALARRESDGKEFWLGLAELKAVDKKSRNYQMLRDYAVFFVNSR